MLFCVGNNKSGSKPCNHDYFIFKLFHPFGVYDFQRHKFSIIMSPLRGSMVFFIA